MAVFEEGDVIRLKSGGPPMTVENPDCGGLYEGKVQTVWFAGAKREVGYFKPSSLEKVEPKAAPGE
jgi:uncharacterized protein YodC (DUF2158 family)